MTQTTILEPPAATERARRFLTIAADLLPLEIVESRRARKVRRSVLAGIVALLVVLAGWYGFAVFQTSVARAGLSGAEADVARLKDKQQQYAPLVDMQTESGAIRAQLSALLAHDLPWSGLIDPAMDKAAGLVTVDELTGDLSDANSATATAVQLPNTSGGHLVGRFTVKGHAANKADLARYIDALAQVRGFGNPYVTSATPHEGVVSFTVQLDITDTVLGGRFTPKNDKK
jgi:hypothetical protein